MDADIFWSLDGGGDLALLDADLSHDHALETAVLISLFGDRRALPDDHLPDGLAYWRSADGDARPGLTGRRGWWADATLPPLGNGQGDHIGSRWWLLSREKWTARVAEKFRVYGEESLEWLIADGVADRVAVTVERDPFQGVSVGIVIQRSGGGLWSGRYDWSWVQLFGAG